MNNTRYELDARMTPTSHSAFIVYGNRAYALQKAADMVSQGFGWVRVQEASAWSNDVQPVTIFERGTI